jgi:hypothetical protein
VFTAGGWLTVRIKELPAVNHGACPRGALVVAAEHDEKPKWITRRSSPPPCHLSYSPPSVGCSILIRYKNSMVLYTALLLHDLRFYTFAVT